MAERRTRAGGAIPGEDERLARPIARTPETFAAAVSPAGRSAARLTAVPIPAGEREHAEESDDAL